MEEKDKISLISEVFRAANLAQQATRKRQNEERLQTKNANTICHLCQVKGHSIKECTALTPKEKYTKCIVQMGLCFVCLGKGSTHHPTQCSSLRDNFGACTNEICRTRMMIHHWTVCPNVVNEEDELRMMAINTQEPSSSKKSEQ